MRAPGPSDGLGIKRLFSQGLGRHRPEEHVDPTSLKLRRPTLRRIARICAEIVFFLEILF